MSFLRLTMLRGARRSVLSRHVLTERRLSSASVASSSASAESTTLRRLGAALFSGLCGTTACLCGWQVKRYGDKVQMVEDRKTALQAAPRPLREVYPELSAGISAGDEYTRVSVEGTFDHARQVLLGPRSAPPGSLLTIGSFSASSSSLRLLLPTERTLRLELDFIGRRLARAPRSRPWICA